MPRRCVTGVFGVLVVLAAAACERRSLAPNDGGGAGQVGVDAAAPDLPIHVVSDARAVDVRLDVIAADTPTDAPQNELYCGGGVYCYGTDICVIGDDPSVAPICAPKPAACTVGLNCGCVPAGFCPRGACSQAEGRVAFCKDVADGSTLDAPSTICPRDPPGSATSCADHASSLVCNYAEPPPSSCSTRCECRGQRWVCDRPCSTGACPANLPTTFTPCSPLNVRCTYPTACGTFTFACDAFEIGAPAVWYCSGACTCDAGADAPGDAAVD